MSAKKKRGPKPFTPETAPRKGRVKGSRNKATPRAILESIVAHACEEHGKARIPRLRQALNELFIDNAALYVRAATEASVRLQQIEQGARLGDDGQPITLVVRWGAPAPHQVVPALELKARVTEPVDVAHEDSPVAPAAAPAVIDKDRERLNRGPWLSVV